MKVNKTENDASEFLETQNLGVVVYCASSPQIGQNYFEAAERLGQLFAEQGIAVINGAGKQGLMGALNDSTLAHGGTSIGVIPKFMVDAGWCHESLTRTILTDTIHERKSLMAEISNAAIALPGGIGTLEELAEIITWKQLGLYNKPIIIMNINGYYDLLLGFLDKMMTEQFMDPGFPYGILCFPNMTKKSCNFAKIYDNPCSIRFAIQRSIPLHFSSSGSLWLLKPILSLSAFLRIKLLLTIH
jgi:hypothetical protein